LIADQRATVLLEFALVALPLIALLVGMLQIGFCLFAKVVLDNAAATMSRQLQTGLAKNVATSGQQNFTSITACGALMGLLDCSLVSVTLRPVADFLGSSGTAPAFNQGVSKSLMLLTVTYTSPLPTWPLQVGPNADPMQFVSMVPFVNEY